MNNELYNVHLLADSIGPTGVRLITWSWTAPRIILAEQNTHQMTVASSASSRAIPAHRLAKQIEGAPYLPAWQKNQAGMQSSVDLTVEEKALADSVCLELRDSALLAIGKLTDKDGLNIHKQFANRYIEPWMHCTQIRTATDIANLLALRCDKAAQPDFRIIAENLYRAIMESTPRPIKHDEWHLPLMQHHIEETGTQIDKLNYETIVDYLQVEDAKRGTDFARHYTTDRYDSVLLDISAGRVAAASYMNHESGDIDVLANVRTAMQLTCSTPGHWSPMAHIATPAKPEDMTYRLDQLHFVESSVEQWSCIVPKAGEQGYCAHFREWKQYRKFFPQEAIRTFREFSD